jgi:Tol biopolymer transport system component
MGEVYRARDARLHREVAVKVLPAGVAGDSEQLARFEREARALAALNHPNIAHVYGFETSDAGPSLLVMELVEGEDLSSRLARGRMPIDEVVSVARQVATALDAAHSSGIVHRDLKPANIKLRDDGTVKVLDFGLAKLASPPAGPTPASGAPSGSAAYPATMASPPALTMDGTLLGTAAYMSPEQARGRPVDRRTDIWAFGCVLYEMLAGRRAFEGDAVADLFGSIVRGEPDWTALPPELPQGIGRLLRRCLQKDVSARLRDIGDALADLDAHRADDSVAPDAGISVARAGSPRSGAVPRPGRIVSWVATIAIASAVAAALGYVSRPAPEAARVQKFHLSIQEDGGEIREPVISPDGRRVAYVGRSRIRVQPLDEWGPRELAGTEAAVRPFWSPDGAWIAYFRSERLLKVPSSGGPVVQICVLPAVQAPLGQISGTWSEDGIITVGMAAGGPILRVPSGGGEPQPVASIPPEAAIDLHDLESLPGGALLTAVHRRAGIDAVGIVEDGSLRVVLEAAGVRHPAYTPPGYLIYERRAPNAGLWAAPFSIDRLQVTGEPFLIGRGTELSASRDGTLAFLGEPEGRARQLSWFSMTGSAGARIGDAREWSEGLALTPDGRRLLAAASDGIWAYDVETGARSRITTGPTDITPAWVDAVTIVFVRSEGTEPVVVMRDVGADSHERPLARRSRFPSVTADGRRVVFNMQGSRGWEVAWIDLDRPSELHRLGDTHAGARFPSVSPDGTFVAYVSGEVGRDEIFLTRLPSGEGKWQLSTEGGGWARVLPQGGGVVYRAPDASFMSVPVTVGHEVRIGRPQKLFDWGAGWLPFYDIARDGTRGVAAVPVGRTMPVPSVSIVQNWHLEFLRPGQ